MYTKIAVNNVYTAFISKWQKIGNNIISKKKVVIHKKIIRHIMDCYVVI